MKHKIVCDSYGDFRRNIIALEEMLDGIGREIVYIKLRMKTYNMDASKYHRNYKLIAWDRPKRTEKQQSIVDTLDQYTREVNYDN